MLQNSVFKSKRTAKEYKNQIFSFVCYDALFFYLYYVQNKKELSDKTMNSHYVFLYNVHQLSGVFTGCLLFGLFFFQKSHLKANNPKCITEHFNSVQ